MAAPSVSAAGLADWHDHLQSSPSNHSALARLQTEFGPADTFHSDRTLILSHFVACLEAVISQTTDAGFAWTVGRSATHATGGKIGRAILGSKTLGSGLRRLCDFVPLLQDASQLKIEVDDDWCNLNYKILDPNLWPRQAEALYSLGIYASLVFSTAPEAWRDVEITIEVERDEANAKLHSVVNANIVYGGETNTIRFPARLLNLPMNLAVPAETSLHAELYRALAAKRNSIAMSDRVCEVIYGSVGEHAMSQDSIAHTLGVSGGTMRRKLAAEGTSNQQLLDNCRMRLAPSGERLRPASDRFGQDRSPQPARAVPVLLRTAPRARRSGLAEPHRLRHGGSVRRVEAYRTTALA